MQRVAVNEEGFVTMILDKNQSGVSVAQVATTRSGGNVRASARPLEDALSRERWTYD